MAAVERAIAGAASRQKDKARGQKSLFGGDDDSASNEPSSQAGGSLPEAVELTGLFIKQGPVVQVKNSQGRVQVEKDRDRDIAYAGPLAVLVDRGSASASEIFAGAIQDYHRDTFMVVPKPDDWDDFIRADRAFFASQGGNVSIGVHLPRMMEAAGLQVTDITQTTKDGHPGSPTWNWVTNYVLSVLPKLDASSLPPAKARRLKRQWLAAGRQRSSLLIAPCVLDIVGRKPGAVAGFAYSKPMASTAEEWNYEHLNKFLANPKASVPGTKMAFAGISKPEERAALIAWLRGKSDAPKPLP